MKSFQGRFLTSVYSVSKLLILPLLTLLFFACKKKSDKEPPRVIIESPYENQTFSTVDTISVVASLTDNEQLKSVTIELLTSDNQIVGERKSYPVSGSSSQFGIDFAIDQPFLISGPYILAVRASDGTNHGSAFRDIQLTSIPREIENFLVVTKTSAEAQVWSSTDFSDWENELDVNTHFKAAALNYKQNVLGITGGDFGDATFYSSVDFTPGNNIPNYGTSSLDYFLGLDFNPETEHFILLQRDPKYWILDKYGASTASEPLQAGFLPEKSFQTEDKIYIDQKALTSPSRMLSSYRPSGLILSSYTVGGPVRLVSKKDQDEDFVWIDADSGTKLALINDFDHLVSTVYSRSDEALYAATEIETNIFLFATSTGIYRYSYTDGSTVVLNQNLEVSELYYESIDGFIYAIAGNVLYKLSSTGQLVDSKTFANPIVFFGIDYNR